MSEFRQRAIEDVARATRFKIPKLLKVIKMAPTCALAYAIAQRECVLELEATLKKWRKERQ